MLPPEPLAPGTAFDRYEIEGVVGEGGMGRVYRAYDRRLQRVVALKVLRPGAGDTNGPARMVREARAAAGLNHPNAVAVFDAGEHDGTAFIAMELVPGRSMRRLVGDDGVPMDLRVRWLADVARALAAAHAGGIVHRDVKPENVVVRDDGVVKVLDFGIARRISPPGAPTGDTITKEGALVGTPLYMAPEQLAGEAIDQRVDQFAWGVVAYELLTGERPWAYSDVRVIASILQQRATPPREQAPDIPPHVEATILRALEKSPADRFESMGALLASLEGQAVIATVRPPPRQEMNADIAQEPSPRAYTSTGATRTWKKPIVGGAVVLVLASVVVLGLPPLLAGRGSTRTAPSGSAPAASAGASSAEPPIALRRSVAVVGLRDLGARPDAGAWRSTAITELLTAQLAAGEALRVVPAERVARARMELRIDADAPLTPEAFTRLGDDLGADLIVTGTIEVRGAGLGSTLELQAAVVDAKTGRTRATAVDAGTDAELHPLVARLATALRAKIGVGEPTPAQHPAAGSSLPEDAEAARVYAQAIDEQHHFHDARAIDLFSAALRVAPRFALGHAHAAESLARLGHDAEAAAEAKRAFDLSSGLSREERLWIEATYHASAHQWDEAVRTYDALFTFFPDNVEYAVGMLQATSFGGHPKQTLVELERIRRLPPAISEDPRIDYEEGRAAHGTSDYERCLRAALDCRRRAKQRENLFVYAKAGFQEGIARINLGHPDEGLKVLAESRDLASSLGDAYTAHVLEGPMAGEYERRGDLARARAILEGSQSGLLALGNMYWATSASEQIGWLDIEQGRVQEGRRKVEAAIAYYRREDQAHALQGGLPPLSTLVTMQGDPRAGEALANEVIVLAQRSGRKNAEGNAELSLALSARVKGDADGERQHEERALALWQSTKYGSGEARARHTIGEREWAAGDLAGARRDLEAALRLRDERTERFDAAETRLALARVALDEGRPADAATLAEEALAVYETAQATPFRAMALAVLARARGGTEGEKLAAEALAIATDDVAARLRARLDVARARVAREPAVARADLAAIARDGAAVHHEDVVAETRRLLSERR